MIDEVTNSRYRRCYIEIVYYTGSVEISPIYEYTGRAYFFTTSAVDLGYIISQENTGNGWCYCNNSGGLLE